MGRCQYNQFMIIGNSWGHSYNANNGVLYLAKHRIREKTKVKYEDKVEVEEKGL